MPTNRPAQLGLQQAQEDDEHVVGGMDDDTGGCVSPHTHQAQYQTNGENLEHGHTQPILQMAHGEKQGGEQEAELGLDDSQATAIRKILETTGGPGPGVGPGGQGVQGARGARGVILRSYLWCDVWRVEAQRLAERAAETLTVEAGIEFTPAHRRLWAEFTGRVALPPNVRELFARAAEGGAEAAVAAAGHGEGGRMTRESIGTAATGTVLIADDEERILRPLARALPVPVSRNGE
mgnify:CR=1 FL=1